MKKDIMSVLPDGSEFVSWEMPCSYDTVIHVNPAHKMSADNNDGSSEAPLKTISEAARRAVAGTKVVIHQGTYRECVRPQAGGEGPEKMVLYEAAGDGDVVIKASEEVTEFEKSTGWIMGEIEGEEKTPIIWCHHLNPEQFKGYNPFCAVNILHDRLFIEYDKTDMTPYLNRRGMVFCDGKPLVQVALYRQMTEQPGSYWVEANGQTIHFRLENDEDPRMHTIELTCREQCFAPEIPFLSYIHVKGITCAHAAMGAPVPQRGALSCMRGHHWIIENCTIDWSNAVGIDIGNECWHHDILPDQQIGYTIIRGCHIKDVGVCGIAGLFAEHVLIEDNLIEGTGWQKMELSWEAAGIKLHNSVGSLFRRNIFKRTYRADHLWLDCGNENNRITQNLFLDGIEQREAVFIECSRDETNLIDNNIFWNIEGRFDQEKIPKEPGSSGWYKLREHDVVNGYGVYGEGTDHLYLSNNFFGKCRGSGYFAKPVSFRMGQDMMRGGTGRDTRIFNNFFYECGQSAITFPTQHNEAENNCYANQPSGYLRVMYPEPEVCLDLKTWKEFYGFDQNGQTAWVSVKVDTEAYTITFDEAAKKPVFFHGQEKRINLIDNAEKLKPVSTNPLTAGDFFGEARGEQSFPGPFTSIENKKVYFIDPRKKIY